MNHNQEAQQGNQRAKEVAWEGSEFHFVAATVEIASAAVHLYHAYRMTKNRLQAEKEVGDALTGHGVKHISQALLRLENAIKELQQANANMDVAVWNLPAQEQAKAVKAKKE